MNDRFKFRCFSKKTKKMYEVDSLHLDSENEWVWVHYYNPVYDKDLKIQIEHPKCILMQCTGLKDKNGKLIYEGDIINIWCKNLTKNQISEVKFNEIRAAFTFDYFTDYGNVVPCTMEKTEIEVIGNVYENKELLECQK